VPGVGLERIAELVERVHEAIGSRSVLSPASRDVINRLTDILFIRAFHAYFDQHKETAESGRLAAVRDEQIGRAV